MANTPEYVDYKVRLTKDMHEKIKVKAEAIGVPMQSWIKMEIDKALKRDEE